MHVYGIAVWIEVAPQFLVNDHKQTTHLSIVDRWHDLADIVGCSCCPYIVPIVNSLRIGTSRDRIKLPRNAIGIVEADVLVLSLQVYLNPIVANPCRV